MLRASLLVGLALSAAIVLVPNLPGKDTAMYYSRMARAFAEGRFSGAFYHKIPPLFPVLAGLVAKLGLDAYSAAKLVSCLLHVAGVPVVYALVSTVGARREAEWAAVLYLVCPRLLRYSGNAGPDSGKTLLLMLLVLCMIRHYRRGGLRWLVCGALAGGALAVMRSEGLLFTLAAPIFCVLRAIRTTADRPAAKRAARCAMHVVLFGVIVLSGLGPWMLYVRRTTGYWLTDSRQLRVLARAGVVSPSRLRQYEQTSLDGIEKDVQRNRFGLLRPFHEAVKGLVPAYLLLAAIGLWTRRRRGDPFALEEGVFLCVIALNFVVFYAISGYVTKRYVSATVPFILGWSATGVLEVGTRLRASRIGSQRLVKACAGALLAVCVWDGVLKLRPSLSPSKRARRRLPATIGRWIDAHREELIDGREDSLSSSQAWYHDGRVPVLLAAVPQVAYFARADLVPIQTRYVYSPEAVVSLCRGQRVHAVLLSPDVMARCPGVADALTPEAGFNKVMEWSVDESSFELLSFLPPAKVDRRPAVEAASANR